MFIKKFISLILSIILILSIFVGCNDVSNNNSSSITTDTSSDVYSVDDNKTELNDNSTVDDTSSTEENESNVDSSNTSSEITSSDNTVSVGDSDNNAEQDAPPTFIEPDAEDDNSSNNISNDEKPNTDDEGYNGVTLATSPNYKTGNVTTVKIAANGSVTYKIRGASNKYLTINSSNAYVVYDNKKYEAKNGTISFFVESDELASAQIIFEIGNKGTAAESFIVNFASPKGSWDNKEKIESVGKEINTAIAEGEESGYWYQFKATKAGTVKFYLLSGTDTGVLTVTNNRNSAQRNTDIEDEIKSDTIGKYIELTNVEVGDEIVINLATKGTGGNKYPAVTIKWKIVQ